SAAKRSPHRPGTARTPGLRARSDGVFIVSQTARPSMRKVPVMIGTLFGRSRRRGQRLPPLRTRLHLEVLESRCVMSTLHLTPLVRVSGPDPLIACEPAGWPFANGEAEPQLAVDPTNSNHLVGVWNQSGFGIVAGVSFDDGKNWQEVVIPGIS